MRNLLFLITLFVLSITNVYSQVYTKKYKENKAFEKHPNFKISKDKTIKKTMPSFNISTLLAEDEAVKGLDIPFRFGKDFEVNLSLTDGRWTKTSNGRIWSLKVSSLGAYSINFVFDELNLPEGAELYMFNEDGSMVYGPVTSKQNIKRRMFLTDLIEGETAILHLYEPNKVKNKSILQITKVIHAYKNMFKSSTNEKSTEYTCHNNVDCYTAWDDESDGVALILLSNGFELCTGSLINNTANDYTPNFLTAFHCVDTDSNHEELSVTEIADTESWAFKYNYKYPECGTSQTSIMFNGATYRAAWADTDFALLEMEDSPVGNGNITYLGWDNRDNIPTSGTGIHHPAGDYMKISFDNDALVSHNQ